MSILYASGITVSEKRERKSRVSEIASGEEEVPGCGPGDLSGNRRRWDRKLRSFSHSGRSVPFELIDEWERRWR